MFGFIKKKKSFGIERVMVGAGQERSFDATRMKIKQLLMKVGKQRGKAKIKRLEEEIFEFPQAPLVQTEAKLPVSVEKHLASGTSITSIMYLTTKKFTEAS